MTYAVSDPTRSIEDVSWFVDDVIARRLQGIAAVGRTSRLGGADREINVELDPDRLLALGITAADVSRQLRTTNIDLGGGRGDLGGQEVSIRALGGASIAGRTGRHAAVAVQRSHHPSRPARHRQGRGRRSAQLRHAGR